MQAPVEQFIVSGVAPDVTYARAAAWQGLRGVLGPESDAQWALAQATYQLAQVADGVTGEPSDACRYDIVMQRVPQEIEA